MNHTAYWISGLIIMFILGSILGLRVSPREKALGKLRERARALGLHPRLIAAPGWIRHTAPSGKAGGMVAFYSILLPNAQLPLTQALVEQGTVRVHTGNTQFDGQILDLQGIYALELQANCAGVYWDEGTDLHGTQLEKMKNVLMLLAQQA